MIEKQNTKTYDLEERSFKYAKQVREYIRKLQRTISNFEDIPQLIRSSGSIGANYIEANEAISKKDFIHRIKICRKESKESMFWLRLIDTGNDQNLEKEREELTGEAIELMKIFSSIMRKSQ